MEKPFTAYQGDGPYIFVSYAHNDAAVVFPEMVRLRDAGFNIWYDEGIRPGSSWREEVALALTESRLFLYFVTENSVGSENCHQELNFALSRDRKILAVHLSSVNLTAGIELSLSNKQAIVKPDMSEAAFADKLIGAIRSLMPTLSPVLRTDVTPVREIKTNSVAILPLVNRSSDSENEYLCDGIAEELITGLSRVSDLRVASQLQSFAYKGQVQDISAIGQKLRVANVLTGSIQKSGERVRITTTLTETGTGDVIWSERYDGTIEDVFELQEDVANKVVKALEIQFTVPEQADRPIIDSGTTNPVAYQHFMLARYEFSKSTRQGYLKFHEHIKDAVAADPQFGRAYWMDFIAWILQRNNGFISQEVCYPNAKKSLEESRQSGFVSPVPSIYQERFLDPSLFPSERAQMIEAISALKDSDNSWHGFEYMRLAFLMTGAGLLNGACNYWEYYINNFPLEADFGPSNGNYGNTLFALGRFEKTIEHLTAVLARNPEQVLMLGTRAMLYSRTGQYSKAKADLGTLARTFPRNFAQFYDLYWRRELDAANAYFEWMESQKNLAPLFKIWGCFLLGHTERGLDYLEQGNFDSFFLRVMCLCALTPTIIREVTSHPRYKALLDARNVGDEWRKECLELLAGVEHITGIHVSLDEDY